MVCALIAVSRAVGRGRAEEDWSYPPAEQRKRAVAEVAEVAEQAIAPLVLGIMSRRGG
jgi:hypothetical protein